jgi:3-oxoacyl-[acyl-carrier protein] reductase
MTQPIAFVTGGGSGIGGAPADPAQIAHAIAFLASPTTFITGQTLFVDGGKSLGSLGL